MVMTYRVDFSPEALNDLNSLDKKVAQCTLDRIKWLSAHIEDESYFFKNFVFCFR